LKRGERPGDGGLESSRGRGIGDFRGRVYIAGFLLGGERGMKTREAQIFSILAGRSGRKGKCETVNRVKCNLLKFGKGNARQ
jgi:hypothetical protein